MREETYINPLKKNSLGPSEADCIDKQRCVHRSSAGFVVERKVYTLKVSTRESTLHIHGVDLQGLECLHSEGVDGLVCQSGPRLFVCLID